MTDTAHVQRFSPCWDNGDLGIFSDMEADDDGDYVAHEDYDNLHRIETEQDAEIVRLRAALRDLLQAHYGVPMTGIEATRRGEAARAALQGGDA